MAEIENLKIGNGTLHIVGNQDIVADSWEAGKTYVADRSYVIREHILYVCNTTHTSVEPFDPTKWTATTIGEALGSGTITNDNNLPHFSGTPTQGSTAEAIEKVSEYKSGDSIVFNISNKALYASCVYASSTEIRAFLPLTKKPTSCTVSFTYFEVYCNGLDVDQTSKVSTVTATEKENGIFLKITGNFTSPQVNYTGLTVIQGTITFT